MQSCPSPAVNAGRCSAAPCLTSKHQQYHTAIPSHTPAWWCWSSHITDNSPAAHQLHQVLGEALSPAVPEGVHKDLVVLDGHWVHRSPHLKRSTLEHHTVLVVHTGALREDQQWGGARVKDMVLHPLSNKQPVFGLQHQSRSQSRATNQAYSRVHNTQVLTHCRHP